MTPTSRDALGVELLDRLIDQAQRRHDEDRALAGILQQPQPMRGDDGLAEPGRGLSDDAPAALADRRVDLIEQPCLMGPEGGAHATSARIGWKSQSANASAMIASTRSSPSERTRA